MILGGIEAGGTKFVCLLGTPAGEVIEQARFPTRGPDETLAEVLAFFAAARAGGRGPDAIGVGAFGPLDLRPGPGHGRLLSTPKPGWSGADLLGPLRDGLGVPVAIHTDVTAAALGEARWGAGVGVATLAYVTVGTGIGVGALVAGRPLGGPFHPEAGHVAVPREPGDVFPGLCPFHGDCVEGMASGPALAARWGRPAERLEGAERELAIEMEAGYLASLARTVVYALAPERIVIGGGVGAMEGLVPHVGERLQAALAGYPGLEEHARDDFVVGAGLGAMAGPLGALALAQGAISP